MEDKDPITGIDPYPDALSCEMRSGQGGPARHHPVPRFDLIPESERSGESEGESQKERKSIHGAIRAEGAKERETGFFPI